MNQVLAVFLCAVVTFVSAVKIDFVHDASVSNGACGAHMVHITRQIIDNLNKGQVIDTPIIRTHLTCVLTSQGILNEDGKIQRDNVRKQLILLTGNASRLDRCAVQKRDAPETAFRYYKCISDLLATNNL